jgi:hypothetical protein
VQTIAPASPPAPSTLRDLKLELDAVASTPPPASLTVGETREAAQPEAVQHKQQHSKAAEGGSSDTGGKAEKPTSPLAAALEMLEDEC